VQGKGIVRYGEWSSLEVTAKGPSVRVAINGQLAAEMADTGEQRTVPGFYLSGDGGELTIKDLKIDPLITR
jgi:hypothetical protein